MIPLFYDEAIYLSQATQILSGGSWFQFAEGTHFPFFVWILVPFLSLPVNPLLVGRMVSILMILASAILLYKKVNPITGILFLLLPLTVFHGQTIIIEPLMILMIILAIHFTKQENNRAMLIASSLAFFAKPSALVLLPGLLIFARSTKARLLIMGNVIVLGIIYAALSSRFSGQVEMMDLSHFKENIFRAKLWVTTYVSLPVIMLIAISTVFSFKKAKSYTVWFVFALLATCLMSRNFYPRHIFPLAIPLSILGGIWISEVKVKKAQLLIILGVVGALLVTDVRMLKEPRTFIVGEDRQQFYEDWMSGERLEAVVDYLNNSNVQTLYTEADSLTNYGITKVYGLKPTIRVVPLWSASQRLEFKEGEALLSNRGYLEGLVSDKMNLQVFQRTNGQAIKLYGLGVN